MEDKATTGKATAAQPADDKAKKFRSPQFPFIPLEKAVARAREFESAYHQNPARASSAVKTWSYAEKSSGGIQTIAALVAYGLMEDEGSLDNRRLKLTPLAMTILKDARAGAAAAALKVAALKPKVLSELWGAWGGTRPPDHDCISTLVLDMKFSDEAAARLLSVYDSTILFANLGESDKLADNGGAAEEPTGGEQRDKAPPADKQLPHNPPPPPQTGKVTLMENERVVFAHELAPNHSFRIVVAGEVDADMVEVMKQFAEFQGKIVGKKKQQAVAQGEAKTGEATQGQ